MTAREPGRARRERRRSGVTRPVTAEAAAQTSCGRREPGFPRRRPSRAAACPTAPPGPGRVESLKRPTVKPGTPGPSRPERRPLRAPGSPGLGDRKLWGVNGKKWVVRALRLPTSLPK